jgi:XTP/dITP diphosphohydrolase
MYTLLFATNNAHKVGEIQPLVPATIRVVSLRDAGIDKDIPEPFDTLEENAREKSRAIFELSGKDCFSEDTGLEVEALNGAPGVRSARYSGDNATHEENIALLLHNLEGVENRRARFRTVISLQWQGSEYQFEGVCMGVIITERSGDLGFGYDPVFMPDGAEKTFAQMQMEEKALYSHRGKAVSKLVEFLNRKNNS